MLTLSKYLNNFVVGIDVASEFSFAAFLCPDGSQYRKPFKFDHSAVGFNYLLEQIKKAEEEFAMKPVFFMESTGVYHLTLFHFLKGNKFEALVINPLVTNFNKNKSIRKVKNDRNDALTIAKLGKYEDIKVSSDSDINTLTLKLLVRDYYKLIDARTSFKKKLSATLSIFFCGYQNVFSDVCGLVSVSILEKYPSPQAIISATKQEIVDILLLSRKGLSWAEKKCQKLVECAENACFFGFADSKLSISVVSNLTLYKSIDAEANRLMDQIKEFINSPDLPPALQSNIKLLTSIAGIGFSTALTIIAEVGSVDRFLTPKQLVAFFGVDPAVNESGNFKSDRVKMSKRGTRFGRRALYAAALASIRTKRNGQPLNPVLLKYYQENLKGKKPKVALVAIMHKLIKYIYSVLKNQQEFQIRDPKVHKQMFLENNSRLVS